MDLSLNLITNLMSPNLRHTGSYCQYDANHFIFFIIDFIRINIFDFTDLVLRSYFKTCNVSGCYKSPVYVTQSFCYKADADSGDPAKQIMISRC